MDLLPQTPGQICYVPRKVVSFQEEALIVPGPVTKRWNAGRVLYGLGTGLSMAATGVASIGGIIVAAGGSTASLSDPGPAMSLAGTVGNITGTTLLISGLAAQHSALGLIGKDSGRGKFIAGVVFGALGLASVGTGYIVGGMDIPNKDIINYAVGYGGTLLLTTSGISKIGRRLGRDDWGEYWHFTSQSKRRLFGDVFGRENVQIQTYGNVQSCIANLHGLAAREMSAEKIDFNDPNYELIVCARAVKGQ